MTYDARTSWEKDISKSFGTFPAQGLIRLIRGTYPKLVPILKNSKVLDSGCGDGRNSKFLQEEGFEVTGMEISDKICEQLKSNYPGIDFAVGQSSNLPFDDGQFDLVLSWHAIYYVGLGEQDVSLNIKELRRVTKNAPDSRVIISIPMPSSFIYAGSELVKILDKVEYRKINNDPFDIRNGEVLACFPSEGILVDTLVEAGFTDIVVGEEMGKWFGFQYDWWVIVANVS